MNQIKSLLIVLFTMSLVSLTAQDHYIVELEKRTPDAKSMVAAFEGFPSIPFIATDTDGTEQNLYNYRGKTVMLWFWNESCEVCYNLFAVCNNLVDKFGSKLQIISFSDEDKATSRALKEEYGMKYPVIANSKMLADGPYGSALGYPRVFVIDSYGINRLVLSSEVMEGNFDVSVILEGIIHDLCNQ